MLGNLKKTTIERKKTGFLWRVLRLGGGRRYNANTTGGIEWAVYEVFDTFCFVLLFCLQSRIIFFLFSIRQSA